MKPKRSVFLLKVHNQENSEIFDRCGVFDLFHYCEYVSMSVGERVFSKTTYRIF